MQAIGLASAADCGCFCIYYLFYSPVGTILELSRFEEFKRWLRDAVDEELLKLEALVSV